MKTTKIRIEVWSDVVCPFCYIGKKNIEQAITNLNAKDNVKVIWHSYQLDPTFSKDKSMLYYNYHNQRSGYTENQLKPMGERLNILGKEYDFEFNFEKTKVVNSLNMHRLLHWSKEFEMYSKLNEAFMTAYFSNGIDLLIENELLKIVSTVGLNQEKAKEILNSDSYLQQVKKDIMRSNTLGIRGVPYFIINESERVSGAQDVKVLEKIISNSLKLITEKQIETKNNVCLPNSGCEID